MDPKSEDCYFYYYSTCSKGDACPFRHCPQALGSEKVCALWREGRCFRKDCMFRHMDIKVKRSETPCYWESQPGGCTKPHCVFMHTKGKRVAGGLITKKNRSNPTAVVSPSPEDELGINLPLVVGAPSDEQETIRTPQVAPVVVNPFDEESDADSSTGSPVKVPATKKVKIPKMEPSRIQTKKDGVLSRVSQPAVMPERSDEGFEVKSLDEIQDEELRRVKEALAKADEYLTKSYDEDTFPAEDYEDVMEDMEETEKTNISIPGNRRTIQISKPEGLKPRYVEPKLQTLGGGRRIIVVDEDANDANVEASPKKTVMDRLGTNKSQDERLASRREVACSGITSRLGIKKSADSMDTDKKITTSSVKGRLGIIRRVNQDTKGSDLNNSSNGRHAESSVKSRLGLTRTTRQRLSDDENNQDQDIKFVVRQPEDLGPRIKLKRNTSEPRQRQEGSLGIKSWEEIRRAKRARLGLQGDTDEDQEVTRPSPPRRRPIKTDLQIYRPPSAKSDSMDAVKPSIKSRLESRLEVNTASNVKSRLDLKTKDEPRKRPAGWGVKTFSEIMREKQLQKQATSQSSPEKNTAQVAPVKRTSKRTITPITFNDEPVKREPPRKTKKFTPIVFDLEKGDGKSVEAESEDVPQVSAGGDDAFEQRTISPIVFTKPQTEEEQGDAVYGRAPHLKKTTRTFSPISFATTDDEPVEAERKQKVTLEKLTIPQIRRRSSSGLKSPGGSPPFKSPTSKSPKPKSPQGSTPSTPGLKSPLAASQASRQPETPTLTTSKSQGEDSFLHEMDYLLEDEEGEQVEGAVDDIGEDDLLNEMEELLA